MGSLAGSPWHFRKNYRPIEPSSFQDVGPLSSSRLPLRPAVRRRPRPKNLQEESPERAGSMKPATRRPTPRSCPPLSGRPRSCPQNLHPHNGDETGRGYSETCHPRIPEHAWPQYAVRAALTRLARHCCHIDHDVTHDETSIRPMGGGTHPSWSHLKVAGPPPVGLGYGRFQLAGQSTPSKEAPH